MRVYSTTNIHPRRLKQIRPILPFIGDGVWLAGGSLRTLIRGEEVCDFDLFFRSFEKVLPLRERLKALRFKETFACPENKLFTYEKGKTKVQLICENEYIAPDWVIMSFDMSACRAAYDGERFYFTRKFVKSVLTKKLSIQNLTFPVATIKRLIKYSKKGYCIRQAAEDFVRLVTDREKVFDGDSLRHYID